MTSGAACCAIDAHFDRAVAVRELERYRRRGAAPSTRELLSAIREAGVEGATVLDVGGGVGAIPVELLDAGAACATVVEASAAFLNAAGEEAERRRHAGRLKLVHGDFVALAPQIPIADVVTLDKVVCCYPDGDRLVESSTSRARRLYGIVYPRDDWWMRAAVAVQNALRRLRGSDFRVHVHASAAMEDAILSGGFRPRRRWRGLTWVVALYERPSASP